MLFFFLFIVLGAGLFFTIAFGLYKEEFPESNANKNNNIIPTEYKTRKRRKEIVGISIENPSKILYASSILEASQKYNLHNI